LLLVVFALVVEPACGIALALCLLALVCLLAAIIPLA
jgi:hypothetical protein